MSTALKKSEVRNRKDDAKAINVKDVPVSPEGAVQEEPRHPRREASGTFEEISVTSTSENIVSCFKLVTDALAQRRNRANRRVIFHYYTLGALLSLYVLVRVFNDPVEDFGKFLVFMCAVTIATLSLASRTTDKLIRDAESSVVSDVLVPQSDTKAYLFNGTVVGVCLLALSDEIDKENENDYYKFPIEDQAVYITAWTVMRKYRRTGLGMDLLFWAVNTARDVTSKKVKPHANRIIIETISAENEAENLLMAAGFELNNSRKIEGWMGKCGMEYRQWILHMDAIGAIMEEKVEESSEPTI